MNARSWPSTSRGFSCATTNAAVAARVPRRLRALEHVLHDDALDGLWPRCALQSHATPMVSRKQSWPKTGPSSCATHWAAKSVVAWASVPARRSLEKLNERAGAAEDEGGGAVRRRDRSRDDLAKLAP